MKTFVIALTSLAVFCLLGGCNRVVQNTGMDERKFLMTFFGTAFPTNQTHLEFVYRAGIRGFVAIARVNGPPAEIKKLLGTLGVNDLRPGDEKDDVSKILQLRLAGLAKEKTNVLLAGLAGTEYRWQSITASNDLCEYYVGTDYSHFIFVDLRR